MESKAGSILTLIGGILTLIGAAIVLIVTIVILSLSPLSDKISDGEITLLTLAIILSCIFIVLLIGGILKIHASNLMKNKKTTMKGGVIAIITGIIISDILSLIGGIIAVVQASEK